MVGTAGSSDALNVGNWIIGGTAVIQFLVLIMQIQRSGRAEKREVTMMPGAVEKPLFEAHVVDNKREHENLFAKIGGVERGMISRIETSFQQLRSERTLDMNALHNATAETSKELGALKAVNEVQSQRLAAIDSKLDRVIERNVRRDVR